MDTKMLPINLQLCPLESFSIHSNGEFKGHSETFQTLELGKDICLGIENAYYDDVDDDFGIVITHQDGKTNKDFVNCEVKKLFLTSNDGWRHTDDDQVVHIAVHTNSGNFKVSVFNAHESEQLRKVVLQSRYLKFSEYL